MTLRRFRQDLNNVTSWVLLIVTVATIVTGLIAHLWDLNGFTWHTTFGYVMIAAVVAHLLLNARQLFAYSAFRLRRGIRSALSKPRPTAARRAPVPTGKAATAKAVLLSRRGLIGIGLGATAGYALGHGVRPQPQLARGTDLGLVYHQWSAAPGMVDAVGALTSLGRQPPLYKAYDDSARLGLPRPVSAGGLPTEIAITRRRSVRSYGTTPMTVDELAKVLLLTGGLTTDGRRTHPSSGALYPIETYVVVHDVDGVAPGVYHYGVERHELHTIRTGDFRQYVVDKGLNQDFLGEGSAVIYLTMIFQRMRFKYGERSYRYGLIEAGHLGQNLYLAATSLGLGACAVGAYDDRGIDELLGIDGAEEVSVYLLSLGREA